MAGKHSVEEEFREFVSARSAALLRTAYLLAGDWATAEDLLQTALTKTYLAWQRLGQIEAVEPYARRVLINTATSWWRRRWHGERPTAVLPERPAPDQFEEQLERDALWRHVRALPARQRAILVLRYYEDMSEAQAAALLNISPGTVKSQTSRALATLRRRLGADAPTVAGRGGTGRTTTDSQTAGPASGAPTADPAPPSVPTAGVRTPGIQTPGVPTSDTQTPGVPISGTQAPDTRATRHLPQPPDDLGWVPPADPASTGIGIERVGAENR